MSDHRSQSELRPPPPPPAKAETHIRFDLEPGRTRVGAPAGAALRRIRRRPPIVGFILVAVGVLVLLVATLVLISALR